MNFAEYTTQSFAYLHQDDILNEVLNICIVFGIKRNQWELEQYGQYFTLSNGLKFVKVSFDKNKVIFEGSSIKKIVFKSYEHDSDYFAALITMILFKYQTKIAYTTPVKALQAL